MERQALRNRMMSIQTKVQGLIRDVNSLKGGVEKDKDEMVISFATLEKTSKLLATIEHNLAQAVRHEDKCARIEPMSY